MLHPRCPGTRSTLLFIVYISVILFMFHTFQHNDKLQQAFGRGLHLHHDHEDVPANDINVTILMWTSFYGNFYFKN